MEKNVVTKPKMNTRHDPCVALRGQVVVEAMTALVLADFLLINNCSKIEKTLCLK